jgi:hypothetical protein
MSRVARLLIGELAKSKTRIHEAAINKLMEEVK